MHDVIHGVETMIRPIETANSVTACLFLKVGLPLECQATNGVSHFLEHMCFRGTTRRTAYDITKSVDSLGGYINAYTTKEFTCYYITVLPEHMVEAMDILVDVVFHSVHDAAHVDLEASVITEEINMYEDTPDDKILDILADQMFQTTYLKYPILGRVDTISSFTQETVRQHYSHYFFQDNVTCVVAGAIPDVTGLKATIQSMFESVSFHSGDAGPRLNALNEPFESRTHHTKKDLEQMHVCYGFPGVGYRDDHRYAVTMLTTLMGGSMSSRLFQAVRETAGLAYAIYCTSVNYDDVGNVMVYAGTSIEQFQRAQECIELEIKQLVNGVSDDEFDRTARQLKGNIMLNLEGSSSWANWLGRQLIYNTGMTTMADLQKKLNAVTKQHVLMACDTVFLSGKQIKVSLGK